MSTIPHAGDRSYAQQVGVRNRAQTSCLRVLQVIPGDEAGSSMIFAKREATALERAGITVQFFFLASRTSPMRLATEWRRLQKQVRQFQPDVIHAQFGTVTGFVAAYATRVPTVVTFRGS